MTTIAQLTTDDYEEWRTLWLAYLDFYESNLGEATTEHTFAQLLDANSAVHGVLAKNDAGEAIGLVHWVIHPATWTTTNYCYLEDLFVAPNARSGGVGAALIEHVHGEAKAEGSAKVYWLTAESNATARALYDRVATRSGMIQYQIKID
ncbi:GNAT family N-acetyltransferase [Humidisolicoccus flavus]|uniref:GNAT family N-acetyltransferase n=1 Tax=Humidisolicoccus flavus TaxID=3111414 RepID=UPI00324BF852